MISSNGMELMVKASRAEFGSDNKKYDPVRAELSREILHRELEGRKHRKEAIQNAISRMKDWFRSFQSQNVGRAKLA